MGQAIAAASRYWNGEKDTIPPLVYRRSKEFYRGTSIDHQDYKRDRALMVYRLSLDLHVPESVVETYLEECRSHTRPNLSNVTRPN